MGNTFGPGVRTYVHQPGAPRHTDIFKFNEGAACLVTLEVGVGIYLHVSLTLISFVFSSPKKRDFSLWLSSL